MARKKSAAVRPHRVVKVPSGNVPSATVINVSEGADAHHGITVSLNEPKRRRQRKRTGTV